MSRSSKLTRVIRAHLVPMGLGCASALAVVAAGVVLVSKPFARTESAMLMGFAPGVIPSADGFVASGAVGSEAFGRTVSDQPIALATQVAAAEVVRRFETPAAVAAPAPMEAPASPAPANSNVLALATPSTGGAATAAGATSPSGPTLRLQLSRDPTSRVRSALPFDLATPKGERPRDHVLVGNVPTGVTFSTGRPRGPGVWYLRIADAPVTEIVLAPTAPNDFVLTFMLVDVDGVVVNGLSLGVTLADQAPWSRRAASLGATGAAVGVAAAAAVVGVSRAIAAPSYLGAGGTVAAGSAGTRRPVTRASVPSPRLVRRDRSGLRIVRPTVVPAVVAQPPPPTPVFGSWTASPTSFTEPLPGTLPPTPYR